MNDFGHMEAIYLLGIGGIGMSALARYFLAGRYFVCGYDRTSTALTTLLEEEGCVISYEDDISTLPEILREPSKRDSVIVIMTPAVPYDSVLLNYFKNNGYRIYKRSEILGMISGKTETIAVAGTHGKTTVSTMAAHILTASRTGCSAFLGGISKNYNTNLLLSDSRYTVMEADEFDRSFLTLSPLIAVITSVDPDHLDIYGSASVMVSAYGEFCRCVRKNGILIVHEDIATKLPSPDGVTVFTYGTGDGASFRATGIQRGEQFYLFNLETPQGLIENIRLLMPGMVNILNASAAAAAALCAGARPEEIVNALFLYRGVKRRFDIRFSSDKLVYIDDYAHHPREIEALVSAIRDFYPGKEITGIFQPHLYTRTRDFAGGFAKALDMMDHVYLLPLYPARENPLPGITSDTIRSLMKNKSVRLAEVSELPDILNNISEGVILTVGAGNIDRLAEPVTAMLKGRER